MFTMFVWVVNVCLTHGGHSHAFSSYRVENYDFRVVFGHVWSRVYI